MYYRQCCLSLDILQYDAEDNDAGVLTELPSGIRQMCKIWVCDSGSSALCVNASLGMSKYSNVSDRKLTVASGQFIPIVSTGDFKADFWNP